MIKTRSAALVSRGQLAERLMRMQRQIDVALDQALALGDERGIDPIWARARQQVRQFALRPGKRIRPLLVMIGHGIATGAAEPDPAVIRTAAALELLHTFLLVHDDVADRATTRRGGPSLNRMLARGRFGDDLAVVMGDHLFARAIELILESGSSRASDAARCLLQACRFTAAGQLLDLQLSRAPLGEVTLFQTLKVAQLKTARYAFVAPLICGAILGGADEALKDALERAGRNAGIAFQLRDDLLGLFGDGERSGKSSSTDYFEGKRTFPVIAAWTRADARGRRRLEELWTLSPKAQAGLQEARLQIEQHGGRDATERAIERATRVARRALTALPARAPAFELLDHLFAQLAGRAA
jgi:geranylgeranyl diphosphate synthase type I